jgi:hypothetical protein
VEEVPYTALKKFADLLLMIGECAEASLFGTR